MRSTTRLDHEVRIEEAVKLILAEIDDTPDASALADRVCMSRFHFHRVFLALLGETVGDMSRRLRLERAANQLRTTEEPITCLAFEAGYATHEAFIRAFKQAFACTPSNFRAKLGYDGLLPTPNGVHFNDPGLASLRFARGGTTKMNVEIREISAKKAICMTHIGPYYMIGQVFGKLHAWCMSQGIQHGMGIAFYYDDPQTTPPDQLRSDAGMIIDPLPSFDNSEMHVVEVAAGRYAVAVHEGPYDGLNAAWAEFYGRWFPASGLELGSTPPFELYVNDCMSVKPEDVRTELYMSLAAEPAR